MLTFTAVLCLAWSALAHDAKAQNDAYTAVAQSATSTGSQQVQFNFTITSWSTQDDIKRLGAILKEKGQDALLAEIQKLDAGRINRVGETGNQIAVAEKWQNGDKTVITMITARRMSMFEQKQRGVSKGYPFAFLQVTVNASGEGDGKLVAAAKVVYDKKGDTFRLEPHGQGATPISNVKQQK
jgi:methionyl-tRNA formyltransferase